MNDLTLRDARATAYHLAIGRLHTAESRLAHATVQVDFLRRKVADRDLPIWQARLAQAERELGKAARWRNVCAAAVESATERWIEATLLP